MTCYVTVWPSWARAPLLAVPPDMTRFYSQAGKLTRMAWKYYGDRLQAVMPAIGTHTPMRLSNWSTCLGKSPPPFLRVFL